MEPEPRQLCRLSRNFRIIESSLLLNAFPLPPTLLLKSRFQRCQEVFWNSSLFLLPLNFYLRRLAWAG